MAAESPILRWFPELSLADRLSVGGKSASLGELTRAGVPVPPGFVVTTTAFEAFLAGIDPESGIRAEVAGLDGSDTGQVASASARIRERIRKSPMPAAIAESVLEGYRVVSQHGSGCPVAVRSSATCEDSSEASFAGLQDTYLWTVGELQLLDRVRACWASLYNSESITYRRRLALPEERLGMAVVVQRMIDARCAGVMFTRSPTTGDRSVIVIEGSWGLGSSIVSGEVTPDRFVVNKVTGEIISRNVSEKRVEHLPEPTGGVREAPVTGARRNAPCLDTDTIASLWQIARTIERHYGSPQDIEWAVPRDAGPAPEVCVLQSRPETVWAAREKVPAARPAARPFDHVVALMSARKHRS
jgi:pyruvate,water dikinase